MSIKVNQSDLRKLERKMAELDAITKTNGSAYMILDRAGLNIVRDIKKPPIPVDTGNLRRSVIYDSFQKAIISQAPYSGFLEFGTRFQKSQPFFFWKINIGLTRLMSDLNNAINRALR
tara:strand:+ start:502 stop:855 length:354 start_codon:yes stop_codon:yes gene_type:complete